MDLLLVALVVLIAGGAVALATASSPRLSSWLGSTTAVVACALGILPAVRVLAGAPPETMRAAWQVPYGAFFVEIDALSAFFLLPIFAVSGLAAVYGSEYLQAYGAGRRVGTSWLFYNLLVASMALVVVARNGVLFLVAWEVMALASFFLVTFEDEHESVRQAGRTYLIATHLGTAFVLALFLTLGREAGALDFDGFAAAGSSTTVVFLLALVGFGTKAGFFPLHVWLPEAHPAAPSHVSAVMSGVMIKTGIYGLLRTLTFLGAPPEWWGWALCAIGVTSGVAGVLFALAQHDLKRLLAYHSVENIGIIALGIGVGVLGLHADMPALAVLGFGGGLLHVLNHSIFKALLFLGAGAVAHATGTREVDHLGALLKRMPWTGGTFLIGAAAICGLPPLNGFVSEFLIYLGAYRGVTDANGATTLAAVAVIAALALIGGLAAACFAKAFGIVFLGEARSEHVEHAHDPGWAMRLPMLALAGACALIGAGAPAALRVMEPVLRVVTGRSADDLHPSLTMASETLAALVVAFVALIAAGVVIGALRFLLLSGRTVEETVTWDCGYARPSPRMQYTASSFAQPLTDLFAPILRTRHVTRAPEGLFPHHASLLTETPDVCAERFYTPIFAAVENGLGALRWLQHGRVHLYVLYVALTLVVLLVWNLG